MAAEAATGMAKKAGAFIQGGAGLLQGGLGIYNLLQGRRLRKQGERMLRDNPYEIPASMTQSVNLASSMAQGRELAGQDLMEQGIRSSTADRISAATVAASSPSQILAATTQAYRDQQLREQELNLAATQDYRTRQQSYISAIQELAPYEVQKWQNNVLMPAQAKLAAASQASQSGWMNIGRGLNTMTEAGAQLAMYKKPTQTP